jgi:hypothetical protein
LRNQACGGKHIVLDLIDGKVERTRKQNSLFLKQGVIDYHSLGAKLCNKFHQTGSGNLIQRVSQRNNYFTAYAWLFVDVNFK